MRFCLHSIKLRVNFVRRIHIFKMNKAYLRQHPEKETFDFSFQYQVSDKKTRDFNLCRKLTETIQMFLIRIKANVEKELNKKNINIDKTIVNTTILLDGEELDAIDLNTTCENIFKIDKKIILRISEINYEIIVNSPFINSLILPSYLMVGFLVYPKKFESYFTNLNQSKYRWYKSLNKETWIEVLNIESLHYTPQVTDVDNYLKLSILPKNERLEGPEIEAVTSDKVKLGLNGAEVPFEIRHKFTGNKCVKNNFRVVSYNILADLYCDSDYSRTELFPYCPASALELDYRKLLFTKEILGYQADIICLQEVDRKVFKHDLNPLLATFNYSGTFETKAFEVAEGVATFYSESKFTKLTSFRFEPATEGTTSALFADIWNYCTSEALRQRFTHLSTVLQGTVLRSHDSGKAILVANTHLYFHPDSDHIRLLQAGMMIKYIEKFVQDFQFEEKLSIIFCGDFNSVPECGIYELITTGTVPENHIDFKSNAKEAVHGGIHFVHSFKMASAYGTPPFTNFTVLFRDCLDYIFYDLENFSVTQTVPLPSLEELEKNTALPSKVFPSDHVALVADFNEII